MLINLEIKSVETKLAISRYMVIKYDSSRAFVSYWSISKKNSHWFTNL